MKLRIIAFGCEAAAIETGRHNFLPVALPVKFPGEYLSKANALSALFREQGLGSFF